MRVLLRLSKVTGGLIAALLLVAANGFFVGAEFAIARLRPTQVEDFLRTGRPGAKSAKHAVEHIDAYLSACQLGITIASLGLGAVGEPVIHDLLEPIFGDDAQVIGISIATAISFSIITVLHVVLGELAPKSAAISRTGPVALALAPPMRAFYMATKPLVDAFNALGNLVLKPFGIPPASEAGHAPHSEEELRELLRGSQQGGLIGREEQQLSEAALTFGDVRVREVMQPRTSIEAVHLGDPLPAIIETITKTGRTRLPLLEADGDIDNAVGVINAKDLLATALTGDDCDLISVARPLPRVAEGTRVDQLLRDMRRERRHLDLVVDEHGTVVGLVTLEDVLEEIVGEIDDEFDNEAEQLIEEVGDELHVDGSAPVRLVARSLGARLEAHEGTISGFIIEQYGRVPTVGEAILIGEHCGVISAGTDTHIEEVVIQMRLGTP
jgi:CBS domain containing-hemolysin-like protein